MYKLTNTTNIIRVDDGACIPNDPMNVDFQQYLQWRSAGNAPLPAEPVVPQPNVGGFIASMRTALGGPVPMNAMRRQYPDFYDALALGLWDDAKALVVDALGTAFITQAQYAQFQSAFTANNIPITLP